MAELYKGAAKRIETQLGESRNSKVLASFVAYCQAHPEERFWQALRNWSGWSFIIAGTAYDEIQGRQRDTFNWEGKNE